MSLESAFQYFIAPSVVAGIVIIAQYFFFPKMEREKTKETELFHHRKKILIEAMQLVDQHINAQNLEELDPEKFQGHVPLRYVPTEDINVVFSQLVMLVPDKRIPQEFLSIFGPTIFEDILTRRGKFILELQKELYGKATNIAGEEVGFYYNKGPAAR